MRQLPEKRSPNISQASERVPICEWFCDGYKLPSRQPNPHRTATAPQSNPIAHRWKSDRPAHHQSSGRAEMPEHC
ncbi:MAG: hypothetical protein HC852_02020 [Acaryochloridaceae cyanobacterium RU_4_10]|nr:hypothetical protein [Acaryochloridaceae cyanobacterium RU_4_10]